AFNSSDSAFSRGAALDQSSSAACSVGAMAPAFTARERSRLTTTSVPSRPPSLRVPSFIVLPCACCVEGWRSRREMLRDALPAFVVVLLQPRRVQRLPGGADHLARLEHEGH